MFTKQSIQLFNAVPLMGLDSKSGQTATVLDIASLAMSYGYLIDTKNLKELSSVALGTLFLRLKTVLHEIVKGPTFDVSPMWKAWPSVRAVSPIELATMCWIYGQSFEDFSPILFGANPVTGRQSSMTSVYRKSDDAFSVTYAGKGTRELRLLRFEGQEFFERKVGELLSSNVPFSNTEKTFILKALENGINFQAKISMREKLVWIATQSEDWATISPLFNSVNDVLRIAVAIGGKTVHRYYTRTKWHEAGEGDITLNSVTKFSLSTAQGKKLLSALEIVLTNKNTDFETDFLRHEEAWKKLATHIRSDKYSKRFPKASAALLDLRLGWMKSWNAKVEDTEEFLEKVELIATRPGEFIRRFTALVRDGNNHMPCFDGKQGRYELEILLKTLGEAATKADIIQVGNLAKLLEYRASNTKYTETNILPNGKYHTHEIEVSPVEAEIYFKAAVVLWKVINYRMNNKFPYSLDYFSNGIKTIPFGNRVTSDNDSRTSRGDRIKLDFSDSNTIRFFLYWKDSSDVDMSVAAMDSEFLIKDRCSFYRLNTKGMTHSWDIRNGLNGAAEYIDANIKTLKEMGVRYLLMAANVYSGKNFNQFESFCGVMVRDGKTGKHFEPTTVQNRMAISTPSRGITPVLVDLEEKTMIYVDIPFYAKQGDYIDRFHSKVVSSIKTALNIPEKRLTFNDILIHSEGKEKLTNDRFSEVRDEILQKLATL